MKDQQQRLRAIELTLTPLQLVVLWLTKSLQAGTFEDGSQQSPSPREAVANAVYDTVRNCMEGQPEPLIERAVLQARQEADFLYNIIIDLNMAVRTSHENRVREYILLRGFLKAVNRGRRPEDCLEELRSGVLMLLRSVFILEGAIPQVAAERFGNQAILFSDTESNLKLQIQMAEALAKCFNLIATKLGVAEIKLDDVRRSVQPKIDQRVSEWIGSARLTMLSSFGEEKDCQAALKAAFAQPHSPQP